MKRLTFTGAGGVGCGNGYVYVLSPDTLTVLKDGEITGEYKGIGPARQVCAGKNGLVFVTARECGLWCFSIEDGKPVLLSHFRTVEYATGLTVNGDIAFVSCRQYGVEKIDVSDPRAPKHIGLLRMGEAQSAAVYSGLLFGGIWGEMKVVCASAQNGQKMYELPLTGRGDGICVKNGLLYASTGQHRRGMREDSESDPCFGRGNGLECRDLSQNPPVLRWRTEFGFDYTRSCDTWRPIPVGDKIVCGMSSLGVFVVSADKGTIVDHFVIGENDPVTGVASDGTNLYVTAKNSGAYSLPLAGDCEADGWGEISKEPFPAFQTENGVSLRTVFSETGVQVLDAAPFGDGIALACVDRLLVIGKNGNEIGRIALPGGECLALASENGILCAALDREGLAVFDINGNLLGGYKCGKPVQQVCLSESGRYALICCGATEARLLDLADPVAPVCLDVLTNCIGQLYGANLARHRLNNGTMLGFWHRDGLFYADPEHGEKKIGLLPTPRRVGFLGFGPENGIDTDGEEIFYDLSGGLISLPLGKEFSVDDLPVTRGESPLEGKFAVFGDLIAACRRDSGKIALFRKEKNAILPLGQAEISGSPGVPLMIGGRILLPCGYGGLIEVTPCPKR